MDIEEFKHIVGKMCFWLCVSAASAGDGGRGRHRGLSRTDGWTLERLSLLHFYSFFVFYFVCMYVFLFSFKPSGSKATKRAPVSEERRTGWGDDEDEDDSEMLVLSTPSLAFSARVCYTQTFRPQSKLCHQGTICIKGIVCPQRNMTSSHHTYTGGKDKLSRYNITALS